MHNAECKSRRRRCGDGEHFPIAACLLGAAVIIFAKYLRRIYLLTIRRADQLNAVREAPLKQKPN